MKHPVVDNPLCVEDNLQDSHIAKKFHEIFGSQPTFIASAPGRVNLIGEHTDYNNGYVFPVAIDKYVRVAAQKREDRQVTLHALDINERCEFSLEGPFTSRAAWSKYLIGVAHLLQESGRRLVGMDAVITGNVPLGAGLSSSAALTVSAALAFLAVAADCHEPIFREGHHLRKELAALCQRAEHEFAGVNCGIMDGTISLFGQADHALFLDCQSLEHVHVPLNLAEHHIVVCNTMVKRELAASEYNKRRAECEKGVDILRKWLPGISSLRDVTLVDFKKYEEELPALTQKRCRYVIEENARVLEAVSALKTGVNQYRHSEGEGKPAQGTAPTESAVPQESLAQFGKLMNASHTGLRDDYEVSCKELDLLTDIAGSIAGVSGTRMTGAGFGGCTVSIVHRDALEMLRTRVMTEYPQHKGIEPEIYLCNVSGGATIDKR